MEFLEAIKKLNESKVFKEWNKNNKNKYYLSHAFIMKDQQVKEDWQIGYCNKENKKIVTFNVSDEIIKNPETEALNDNKEILKLNLDKIKITLNKALEIAEKKQKEKYSAHIPFKKIIILQNLDLGQVWNITYVTNTFKTLNIKIDSETGEVLSDELLEIFKIER